MWAEQKEWCDTGFGPSIIEKDPAYKGDEGDEPAFKCRYKKGHAGPHDCEAARTDGWIDPSWSDLAVIEQFLGEK